MLGVILVDVLKIHVKRILNSTRTTWRILDTKEIRNLFHSQTDILFAIFEARNKKISISLIKSTLRLMSTQKKELYPAMGPATVHDVYFN